MPPLSLGNKWKSIKPLIGVILGSSPLITCLRSVIVTSTSGDTNFNQVHSRPSFIIKINNSIHM